MRRNDGVDPMTSRPGVQLEFNDIAVDHLPPRTTTTAATKINMGMHGVTEKILACAANQHLSRARLAHESPSQMSQNIFSRA